MSNSVFNLFIIDNNESMAKGLQLFLSRRFGHRLNISIFVKAADALSILNSRTDIVVLDYELPGENGKDIQKEIKRINPQTEVIRISNNEGVLGEIEKLFKGTNETIITGNENVWRKISSTVYKIVTYPIHFLVREFSVNKFVAIFLLTFFTMAVIVFLVLKVFLQI